MGSQTPFRMLDKEIQRNWKKDWNNTTGQQFNKLYIRYINRIRNGHMMSCHFQKLGSHFVDTASATPLECKEAGYRIATLFECAYKRLEQLYNKEAIRAEADGLIAFTDLRAKFPMLCVAEKKNKQVKFGLFYEPIQNGNNIDYRHPGCTTRFYCGGVWVEKKNFYSVDELHTIFNALRADRQKQVDAIINQHKLLEQLITESFGAATMEI